MQYDMNDLNGQSAAAAERQRAFAEALPAGLLAREDSLPEDLARLNASPRCKLGRVYRLVEEISAIRASYIACGKGCSDCCHMNVTISKVEAEKMANASGRKPVEIKRAVPHETDEYFGQACPFLQNDVCSVYEARPLACRLHVSFYSTNIACKGGSEIQGIPELRFSGIEDSLHLLAKERAQTVFADIRDFFPSSQLKVT